MSDAKKLVRIKLDKDNKDTWFKDNEFILLSIDGEFPLSGFTYVKDGELKYNVDGVWYEMFFDLHTYVWASLEGVW